MASETVARGPDWTRASRGRPYATGYGAVLLVEQDEVGKQALEKAFLREGLHLLWARSGHEAEQLACARQPGLILFNPRLAPDDGWVVYRRLLRFGVPIVVLAGSAPAVCRVALSLGAVECLTTTTPPHEIAASVRRVLGQTTRCAHEPREYGGIWLDVAAGLARAGEREVALTPSECALLSALIESQGHVISRDQLVQRVRASAGALPLVRSIDAHVRSIRRKLGDDPREPKLIQAVRGFGYRISSPTLARANGLGEAAFAGLSVTALVIDKERRVQLMNRRAEAALGMESADGRGRACADLLGCGAHGGSDAGCPAWHAGQSAEPQQVSRRICLNERLVLIEETVVPLLDQDGHMVLELRQVNDD